MDAEKIIRSVSTGVQFHFSPSGRAVAFMPSVYEGPALGALQATFFDDRPPAFLYVEERRTLRGHAWVSDSEYVYHGSGFLTNNGLVSADYLRLWNVTTGETRDLPQEFGIRFADYAGIPGCLVTLTETDGKSAFYLLDTYKGRWDRLTVYDRALEKLEVYPLLGISWCPATERMAIVGWPLGEYLAEGVPPNEQNSRCGLSKTAERKTPSRLFVLESNGDCSEIPDTFWGHHPDWSPDGAGLAFIRYVWRKSWHELWTAQIATGTLENLGNTYLVASTLVHPEGFLFAELLDTDGPKNARGGYDSQWHTFRFQGGRIEAQ